MESLEGGEGGDVNTLHIYKNLQVCLFFKKLSPEGDTYYFQLFFLLFKDSRG